MERVRAEMPDLIILDLIMEKHDAGFSFSKTYQNRPVVQKPFPSSWSRPVAKATGYRFSLQDDGYWMKTDDFLDKPVMPEVLIDRVEKTPSEKEGLIP